MEDTDFFYRKLREIFNNLTVEELKIFVLHHPKIVGCTFVTEDDVNSMSKIHREGEAVFGGDHGAEL